MRILLALMFFSPIAVFALIQSGASFVTPAILVMGLMAMATQAFLERRETRA